MKDKIVIISCLIILTALAVGLMGCDTEPAYDRLVDQCERERMFLQCLDHQPLISMANEDTIYECDRAAMRTATRYRYQFTQSQLDNCVVQP